MFVLSVTILLSCISCMTLDTCQLGANLLLMNKKQRLKKKEKKRKKDS